MDHKFWRSANFWSVAVALFIGSAVGLGGYTFLYAKGASYLTNDPAACANCHIMNEQYNSWLKSSHRAVAGCNDCHTPHNIVTKYVTKASNGFWHSFAFTSGRFHEPIRIKKKNHEITEAACRTCHGEIVQAIEGSNQRMGRISCVSCHATVGHL
jgi:cytochrome c nitrite reductase small subunit